ncbi:GNAT family N-acetyltransferase [Bacillus ndiopicus]|uniref:GNAT family N-acetyltransferase n=1 Tax=Bacillus ndiopicus TaxID=1347368 RepID=UPI0005AA721E|nr:GNAT family N-acetyltransferase [Bacillus ndiopicus]
MDKILQRLLRSGVNYIKSDSGLILEALENNLSQASEVDVLLNELLCQLKNSNFKTVRFECPKVFLECLNCTRAKMQIKGERVVYKGDFATPLDVSPQDYEVWSIFNSNSIAFLAEVMRKSIDDAKKFLTEMNAELPLQAHKMYTVYIINNKPVGVVFPHIEPNTNQEGRLFWIGIHPIYLGQGLGKNLHAIGLYRLKNEFSAKSYIGITQVDNHPMKKIMVSNGCIENKETLVSLQYSI